jgi:hypothetical protein
MMHIGFKACGSAPEQLPLQLACDTTSCMQAPDSVVRSAVKALVWRLFSTALTVSVALLVLHDSLQVGGSCGSVYAAQSQHATLRMRCSSWQQACTANTVPVSCIASITIFRCS